MSDFIETKPGQARVSVTDAGEVHLEIGPIDYIPSVELNMKPPYARWFAGEILAAADRAEKVPFATPQDPASSGTGAKEKREQAGVLAGSESSDFAGIAGICSDRFKDHEDHTHVCELAIGHKDEHACLGCSRNSTCDVSWP